MDDHINEVSELVDSDGYTDGLSIVIQFRKGIQDQVAEIVQGRPSDNDPEGWYSAVCTFNASQSANQAFHEVLFQVTDFD